MVDNYNWEIEECLKDYHCGCGVESVIKYFRVKSFTKSKIVHDGSSGNPKKSRKLKLD